MIAEMRLFHQRLDARFKFLCRELKERKMKNEVALRKNLTSRRMNEIELKHKKDRANIQARLTALKTKLAEKKKLKALREKAPSIEKASNRRKRRRREEAKQEMRKKESESSLEIDEKANMINEKFRLGLKILDDLLQKRHLSGPFCEPVDCEKYQIPDYPEIIKHPMDLGTIKENILGHYYKRLNDVWADIDLVWDNCRAYNGPYHRFTIKANALAELVHARRFPECSEIVLRGRTVKKRLIKQTYSPSGKRQRVVRRSTGKRAIESEGDDEPVNVQNISDDEKSDVDDQPINDQNISDDVKKDVEDQPTNVQNISDDAKRDVSHQPINVPNISEDAKCERAITVKGLDLPGKSEQNNTSIHEPAAGLSLPQLAIPESTTIIIEQAKPMKNVLSNPAPSWSSKLGSLSLKMKSFKVQDESIYSSSSSSEDDSENLFEMIKQVSISTALNRGNVLLEEKKLFEPESKILVDISNEEVVTGKELPTKIVIVNEKAPESVNKVIWPTSKDFVPAEEEVTLVKKYSPVFTGDPQASPEPYLAPKESPNEGVTSRDTVSQSLICESPFKPVQVNLEYLPKLGSYPVLGDSRTYLPATEIKQPIDNSSTYLPATEIEQPIGNIKPEVVTDSFDYFNEQADILDDLFS